jgi:hypothetical protein
MADVPRSPLGRPPAGTWLPGVAGAVALVLVLAVLKPWSAPDPGPPAATTQPTFYIAPTERTGHRPYDPVLFGGREPDPAWELWPAGYVVQFGMAGPVKVHGQDGSPAPGAGGPSPSGPAGSAGPEPSPAGTAPASNVVDLGPADHLIALGINTPSEIRVQSLALWLLVENQGGGADEVSIVHLPTLWESSHFLVIGIEDPNAPGQAGPWPPGLYRLEISTAFGDVREVLLRVRPPLD